MKTASTGDNWFFIIIVFGIIFGIFLYAYSDNFYQKCLKTGRTEFECQVLVGNMFGHGSIILDERKYNE